MGRWGYLVLGIVIGFNLSTLVWGYIQGKAKKENQRILWRIVTRETERVGEGNAMWN
mgnify:FL=1